MGGLTMAIFRNVKKGKGTAHERVADFSYSPNDSLAQMIVDAWVDDTFRALLLDPKNAKSLLAQRGIHLDSPVVITENEYYQDHTLKSDNEVVFVLPDKQRLGTVPPGQNLLDTARLLMACTPNGI
jgi:hypothetical protein